MSSKMQKILDGITAILVIIGTFLGLMVIGYVSYKSDENFYKRKQRYMQECSIQHPGDYDAIDKCVNFRQRYDY
ncbi:MAG: hypothetical protein NC218_08295 [Acetobacter sp.]|nr:hypothetical protein [Acetobacter sp.]